MKEMAEKTVPLAAEIYQDLKKANQFKERLICCLLIVIGALVFALAATNIYHIYQWSQFETVVVDSGDGYGNANYVYGENSGGIYNGADSSSSEEDYKQEKIQGNAD